MTERDTSRTIDDAAAAWAAREDRAPLSPSDRRALQAWLNGDPRRPGAYLRARALSLRSESAAALGPGYDPTNFEPAGRAAPSRRRILAWGGMAASLGAVGLVGVGLHAPKAHATDLGEVRLVPLEDGSTMMLNTATRVTVKYDSTHRRIRLVSGEADFSALSDARRPFVVEAGGRRFMVAGTSAFRIRKLKDEPIDILVHHGRIDVAPARSGEGAPLPLGPNTRLEISASPAPHDVPPKPRAVAPSAVSRELAWRTGKIAFEGETLAEAARAFSRYSDIRIVIDDPALAEEPITGLFAANDPVGFSHAAASVFGASVAQSDKSVFISRPSRTD